MTWADFYLICFIVGFALSVISFLGGFLHVPGLHHGHGHHVHVGHGHAHGHTATSVSPFNFFTFAAFLTWFGGAGYLLTRFSSLWLSFGFVIAVAGGLVGSSIVFLFLAKVLIANDEPMNAADYDMIGVLGHLTSAIRGGGTGEMSFSQEGSRRSAPARSEDGEAIAKGTEVLVTRYDKGIAYVRPWQDLTNSKETL
jgi:membrane protein implicated in regulation of membrane protease activity